MYDETATFRFRFWMIGDRAIATRSMYLALLQAFALSVGMGPFAADRAGPRLQGVKTADATVEGFEVMRARQGTRRRRSK
jgi:hypothetical protein